MSDLSHLKHPGPLDDWPRPDQSKEFNDLKLHSKYCTSKKYVCCLHEWIEAELAGELDEPRNDDVTSAQIQENYENAFPSLKRAEKLMSKIDAFLEEHE